MIKAKTDQGWAATLLGGILMALATASTSPAQSFNTLLSFDGSNGTSPVGAVVQGMDGNFYGTTYYGGANDVSSCSGFEYPGCGTVFKITPAGTLTALYSFDGTDGQFPYAGLVQATDGDFYGTTQYGGANCTSSNGIGCGTVFKITPAGALTTLYSFCAQTNCADGFSPYAGLAQANNGNFYGTTGNGGGMNQCPYGSGCGTVFEISPNGTLSTLYRFCAQTNCTDGYLPGAGLALAANGNFYGTTVYGGDFNCGDGLGCGTVFEITPGGTLTTLHSFDGTDGAYPEAVLIEGADGTFYGTTAEGGTDGYGTVFEMSTGSVLTTLHSFVATDGAYPLGGLLQATDGDLYGTTWDGGKNGDGTTFKINPSGTLATLHNFDETDGGYPSAGMIQATNGSLYGVTEGGGAYGNYGTVFSLVGNLAAFVETEPASGRAGVPVIILGNNLTGATSVTFNGTSAAFTVNSTGTAIRAAVPSGATTGYVQVTTPSRTLTSNVKFRVP